MDLIIEKIEYENFEEVEKDFIPKVLNGNVFHVTNEIGFNGIIKDNYIKNNQDKKFKYIYGQSEGSFGRVRGYVCLFDLRNKVNIFEKIGEDGYGLLIQYLNPKSFIFCLKKIEYPSLIEWTEAKIAKENYTKKYVNGDYKTPVDWYNVADFECWYPKDIHLNQIEKIIELKYKKEKDFFEKLSEIGNR